MLYVVEAHGKRMLLAFTGTVISVSALYMTVKWDSDGSVSKVPKMDTTERLPCFAPKGAFKNSGLNLLNDLGEEGFPWSWRLVGPAPATPSASPAAEAKGVAEANAEAEASAAALAAAPAPTAAPAAAAASKKRVRVTGGQVRTKKKPRRAPIATFSLTYHGRSHQYAWNMTIKVRPTSLMERLVDVLRANLNDPTAKFIFFVAKAGNVTAYHPSAGDTVARLLGKADLMTPPRICVVKADNE